MRCEEFKVFWTSFLSSARRRCGTRKSDALDDVQGSFLYSRVQMHCRYHDPFTKDCVLSCTAGYLVCTGYAQGIWYDHSHPRGVSCTTRPFTRECAFLYCKAHMRYADHGRITGGWVMLVLQGANAVR